MITSACRQADTIPRSATTTPPITTARGLQTTTGRPLLFAFEDQGRHFAHPQRGSGGSRTNTLRISGIALRCRGRKRPGIARSHLRKSRFKTLSTDKNHKGYQPRGLCAPHKGSRAASWLFGLRDQLVPFGKPPVGETILAAHAVYTSASFEWLNEALVVRHAPTGLEHVFETPGFYSQISRRFGSYRPYLRYQYINASIRNRYFPTWVFAPVPRLACAMMPASRWRSSCSTTSPPCGTNRATQGLAGAGRIYLLKKAESMIRRTTTILLVLAAAALLQSAPEARLATSPPKQESLAIIVNQSNPVDELSMIELRAVFLGERSHWPNGRRITLVMMEQGQPEREAILREICRLSESDFRRRILQGLFTGEVLVSPKTLATPVGVRKFVFNVPGAIGYLRPEDVDASVKVDSRSTAICQAMPSTLCAFLSVRRGRMSQRIQPTVYGRSGVVCPARGKDSRLFSPVTVPLSGCCYWLAWKPVWSAS